MAHKYTTQPIQSSQNIGPNSQQRNQFGNWNLQNKPNRNHSTTPENYLFNFKETKTHRYTDASKFEHEVGFAVVKDDTIIQHKLPKITSIFFAENYTIFAGVQLANTLETNYILIISDCLSKLLALKNTFPKNYITSNIQSCLVQSKKKNIEFMWVLSQIVILGNEKADKYADQTT